MSLLAQKNTQKKIFSQPKLLRGQVATIICQSNKKTKVAATIKRTGRERERERDLEQKQSNTPLGVCLRKSVSEMKRTKLRQLERE